MRSRVAAVWMFAVVLIFAAAVPVQAQSVAPLPADYLTPGVFSIDGAYLQDGMNAPYSEGYEPQVEGGAVHVVLPLIASRPVDGDVIYCDLHLGAAENSPFAYKNYDSIPVRGRALDNGAQEDTEQLLFVAAFDLPLREDRMDGVYPLGVTIRYRAGGGTVSQLFSIDFAVTDGSEVPSAPAAGSGEAENVGGAGDASGGQLPEGDTAYDPGWDASGGSVDGSPAGGEASSGSPSEPKVIMEQAITAPDPCDAGGVFTVTCTLRNTSRTDKVTNMTATYKSQSADLVPEGGASTSYIESIGPGDAAQFAFRMRAVEAAQAGPQKIDIALAYEGKDGTPYTTADEVTVLIRQKIRLEHDQPVFPADVYIGDMMSATLNLYNKGKGTLYNVTVMLDVPGITPESSAFLGNMESGSSKSADIYAAVTGLDNTEDGSAEDGPAAAMQSAGTPAGDAGTPVSAKAAAAVDDGAGPKAEDVWSDPAGSSGTGTAAGSFVVTYEDEFGDVYEELVPVTTQIEQMDVMDPYDGMDPGAAPDGEDGNGLSWWGGSLIAAGGIGATAAAIYAARRRKKRAQQLAGEDADDDDLF